MSVGNSANFTIRNSTRYSKANNGEMGKGGGREGRKREERKKRKETGQKGERREGGREEKGERKVVGKECQTAGFILRSVLPQKDKNNNEKNK